MEIHPRSIWMLFHALSRKPLISRGFAHKQVIPLPRNWVASARRHQSALCSSSQKDQGVAVEEDPLALVEQAFQALSRKRSAWKRFRDLAAMAINLTTPSETTTNQRRPETLVDVGCDHGLFSASLAASGRFKSVLGVDASLPALEAGAFQLQQDIADVRRRRQLPSLPLQYRLGKGLEGVEPGQADVVCVAGMGVHTIIDVLTGTAIGDSGIPDLEALRCQALLVQPSHARPRNLILLYDALRAEGWMPYNERVVHFNSRWYLSVGFKRICENSFHNEDDCLPGSILADATNHSNSEESKELFLDYLTHYCSWLNDDLRTGGLRGGEDRWFSKFDAIRHQLQGENAQENVTIPS